MTAADRGRFAIHRYHIRVYYDANKTNRGIRAPHTKQVFQIQTTPKSP